MIRHFSFYRLTDGVFTGDVFGSSMEDHHIDNCPPGCGAIEGRFDKWSQKVDLDNLEVVDYQPPKPSIEHEWDTATKRWKLNGSAQTKKDEDAQARVEIARLESTQLRSLRELALGDQGAKVRVKDIDDQIAELRKKLITPST